METQSNKAMKITLKGIAYIILGMMIIAAILVNNKGLVTKISKQIETTVKAQENDIKVAEQTEVESQLEDANQIESVEGGQSVNKDKIEEEQQSEEQTIEVASEALQENEQQELNRTVTATVTARTSTTSREKANEIIGNSEQTDISVNKKAQYKTISSVTISKNMDLTQRTGLSKEDFKILLSRVKQDKSKFFYNNSDYIYDVCQKYQINEIFFCGLISAESGWEIASNHRRTYNYISLMSDGKLLQFSSVQEGLEKAAQKLHNNYLTPGGKFYYGKTLSAVKTKFCPASSTWVDLVYGRMSQIVNSK